MYKSCECTKIKPTLLTALSASKLFNFLSSIAINDLYVTKTIPRIKKRNWKEPKQSIRL